MIGALLVLTRLALAIINPPLQRASGQTLAQADYPDLFARTGITPSFTANLQTILPPSVTDMAYGVVNGTGVYIGLVSTALYRSYDAVTWNAIPLASAGVSVGYPSSVVYCGGSLGMFVIAPSGTFVYTSTDAVTWSISLVYADATLQCVACSNTTIVVGGASDTDNSIQNVWTSSNGVAWTKRAIAGTGGLAITALYWSPGYGGGPATFFLGSASGVIQTSPDGVTWTQQTSHVSQQINAFALGSFGDNGTVMAVGAAGTITISTDTGVTWTAITYQTAATLSGVAWSVATAFVMSGSSVLMSSTNGVATVSGQTTGAGAIFFGNGRYVTCGNEALLATSANLVTWTAAVSALPTHYFNAGAYGNGSSGPIYVVVGDTGNIQSSPTGVTWTSQTSGVSGTLNAALYVGGSINLFIAVGNSGSLTTSPNGTTWTSQTSNLGTANGYAIAYNGTIVVVVGGAGSIVSSTDGVTWTAATALSSFDLVSVAWNGALFCAVGLSGLMQTSPDGVTWTRQYPTGTLNTGSWASVTSDGVGNFYAVQASSYVVYVSTNALVWTPYASPILFTAIGWLNGQLVGYSSTGAVAWSANGRTWTPSSNNARAAIAFGKTYYFSSLSKFIILSSNNAPTTTADGVSFSGQRSLLLEDVAVSASQNKLVAVGNAGIVLYSTDHGVTWTQVTALAGMSATLGSIAYSPSLNSSGLFVAVSSSTLAIFTSPDGAAWTQQSYTNPFLPQSAVFTSVIWAGGGANLFVAVGSLGTIATSPDGVAWTTRTSNTAGYFNKVCYNAALGLFAAVCSLGCRIVTSANGVTWTPVPSAKIGGGAADSVLYTVQSLEARGFVAIGVRLLYSADGVTWTQRYFSDEYTPMFTGASIYSAVDGGVFYPVSSTIGLTGDGIAFTNGASTTVFPVYWGATVVAARSLVFDSVADVYVAVGLAARIARLVRTYNKTTQFVVPALQNEYVYVR